MKSLSVLRDEVEVPFDFPFYYQFISQKGPETEHLLHFHREHELLRIVSGQLKIEVHNQIYVVNAGAYVLISDAALHQLWPEQCSFQRIYFDPHKLFKNNTRCAKHVFNLNNFRALPVVLPLDTPGLSLTLEQLFSAMEQGGSGYELLVEGALYQMWGLMMQHQVYTEKQLVFHKKEEIFQKFDAVLQHIEKEYANPITLDDLAIIAGFATNYFSKFFKLMTGYPPIDFLNKYRIEVACEYLLNSDQHISDITLLCGFNDVSYFIKTFKKNHGMSPRQWQKQWTTNQVTGIAPALSFRTRKNEGL